RDASAGDHRLGRGAALVDAGAADMFALDQGRAMAGLCEGGAEGYAALTSADHDGVVARGRGVIGCLTVAHSWLRAFERSGDRGTGVAGRHVGLMIGRLSDSDRLRGSLDDCSYSIKCAPGALDCRQVSERFHRGLDADWQAWWHRPHQVDRR